MASDKEKEPRSWQQNVLLYVHDLMCMLFVVMLLFLVVFRVILVTGDSMFTTLWDGDYLLLVSELFCGDPEPGDIVVISKQSFDNGSPIVKRVIATEGETVDIDFDMWIVTVTDADGNVRTLDESAYRKLATDARVTTDLQFPIAVGENQFFVMGDNRNHSLDSRDSSIGMVDQRYILGKAVFRFFPFHKIGLIE